MKTNQQIATVNNSSVATLVSLIDNQPTTNSLLVANKFSKRPSDVNRSVSCMILANAKLRSLYKSATYKDEQGKQRPMYLMNRDGFTLLVMGFTGKDALEFKLDYINAFNAMEQQLREIQQRGLVSANRLQIQQNETEYWQGMYAKAMNAYTESSKTMSLMSKNTLRITEMMVEYREALNTIEAEKITKQIEAVKQIVQPVAKKPALRPKKEPKYYYSVVGYATLKDVFLGIKKAAELGRKASALCRAKGIKTEEIPDPRFGRVKIYPESVLKEVFATAECR